MDVVSNLVAMMTEKKTKSMGGSQFDEMVKVKVVKYQRWAKTRSIAIDDEEVCMSEM